MSGGLNFTNPERRMLRAMLGAPDAIHSLSQVMSACNWNDQAVAVGAGQGLSDKGLAETQESVRRTIHPGKEAIMQLQMDCLRLVYGHGFHLKRNQQWPNCKRSLNAMRQVQVLVYSRNSAYNLMLEPLYVRIHQHSNLNFKQEICFLHLPADEEDLSERLLAHFKGQRIG